MPLSMPGHREPHLDPSASTLPLPRALPNELLNAIFDHLSQDVLTRVALVSRRWRASAERLLYSAIVIDEVLPRSSPGALKGTQTMPAVPAATLRCCETLSSRPHLTEYVRRFHVRWRTDAVESPALLLLIAQNVVRTLVPTLVHLDSLELAFGLAEHFPALLVPPPPPPPSGSAAVATAAFLLRPFRLPSLRTLALHGIGEPPEHVLRNHPALLHLRLGDYRKPLRLQPTDVPHLRSFCGYPATAASLLPGRPVQVLGLVGRELATELDLARIASGSLPLRSLDLSAVSVTLTLLRNLSRHLSHVEWLRVRLALRHTLHYALPGIRLLTALTTVLAAFYNLRSLDLSPTNAAVAACDGQIAVEEHHLCMVWMRACPSLRRVIFPSRTGWSLSETGTWISDSPGTLARCYFATLVRDRQV